MLILEQPMLTAAQIPSFSEECCSASAIEVCSSFSTLTAAKVERGISDAYVTLLNFSLSVSALL